MTDGESDSNRAREQPKSDSRGSLVRRVVEWFSRADALAESSESSPVGARMHVLLKRARASADIANVALTAEPLDESVRAIACELYRQSAYWAALARANGSGLVPSASEASVWEFVDDSILASEELGAAPQTLRDRLRTASFVQYAQLALPELRATCEELRKLSAAVLVDANEHDQRTRTVRQQRFNRLAGLVLVLVGVGLGVPLVRVSLQQRSEVSAGKPWRASSHYPSGGCTSPDQDCSGGYFFHTEGDDPSPWVEFDLGADVVVSRVRVDNRKDCCFERAVPLAVEVSRDQRSWQTVAKRAQVFNSWEAAFDPVPARYVRLRVMHAGILHLSHVSIYR